MDGGYSCRFVLASTELALHRLIVSDDWVLTLLLGISCHIEPASNGHERHSLHLLYPVLFDYVHIGVLLFGA